MALDTVVSAERRGVVQCFLGGTWGNVVSILSALGWQCHPVGRLDPEDPAFAFLADELARWDVRRDFLHLAPTARVPIIAQRNKANPGGGFQHAFSYRCARCRRYLPGYAPVRVDGAAQALKDLPPAQVFSFDRAVPGNLVLAKEAAAAWNCQFEGARGGMYQEGSLLADFVETLTGRRYPLQLRAHGAPPALNPIPLEVAMRKVCPVCRGFQPATSDAGRASAAPLPGPWKSVRRPGYVGSGKQAAAQELDQRYGPGRWRIAYGWHGETITREQALDHYTAAYELKGWWGPGTVESFWQSNKVLQVRHHPEPRSLPVRASVNF
jgi:hypothetical protein